MGNLIISELEKIKNPLLKAFAFRFYNVFKSIVLPIILGAIFLELKEHGSFEGLFDKDMWLNLLYTIVFTLVGSAIAGLDKINRVQSK